MADLAPGGFDIAGLGFSDHVLELGKQMPGDQSIAWPKAQETSRAVREYLRALDAAYNQEGTGGGDDGGSSGGSRRKPPKEVSLTDPQM